MIGQLALFDADGRPAPELAPDTPCGDCGLATIPPSGPDRCEWYMVHDHVWEAAHPWNDQGGAIAYLCIGCLEVRLGRRLAPSDFTDAPINELSPWADTFRLAERKGHR